MLLLKKKALNKAVALELGCLSGKMKVVCWLFCDNYHAIILFPVVKTFTFFACFYKVTLKTVEDALHVFGPVIRILIQIL